jgi:hypothetical protein
MNQDFNFNACKSISILSLSTIYEYHNATKGS